MLRLPLYFQTSRGQSVRSPCRGTDRVCLDYFFTSKRAGAISSLSLCGGPIEFAEIITLLPNELRLSAPSPYVGGPIEFAEIITLLPNELRLSAPSPYVGGPIEFAEIITLPPNEQGLSAPSPCVGGPIEFAEIITLPPNEQGLSAPSPCRGTDRVCLDYRFTSKRAGAISSLSLWERVGVRGKPSSFMLMSCLSKGLPREKYGT